jgi:hypothetical protein
MSVCVYVCVCVCVCVCVLCPVCVCVCVCECVYCFEYAIQDVPPCPPWAIYKKSGECGEIESRGGAALGQAEAACAARNSALAQQRAELWVHTRAHTHTHTHTHSHTHTHTHTYIHIYTNKHTHLHTHTHTHIKHTLTPRNSLALLFSLACDVQQIFIF